MNKYIEYELPKIKLILENNIIFIQDDNEDKEYIEIKNNIEKIIDYLTLMFTKSNEESKNIYLIIIQTLHKLQSYTSSIQYETQPKSKKIKVIQTYINNYLVIVGINNIDKNNIKDVFNEIWFGIIDKLGCLGANKSEHDYYRLVTKTLVKYYEIEEIKEISELDNVENWWHLLYNFCLKLYCGNYICKNDIMLNDTLDNIIWRSQQLIFKKLHNALCMKETPHITNFIITIETDFILYKDAERISNAIKQISAKRIYKYWFRAITNPEYKICKKRLLNEYNQDIEMINNIKIK